MCRRRTFAAGRVAHRRLPALQMVEGGVSGGLLRNWTCTRHSPEAAEEAKARTVTTLSLLSGQEMSRRSQSVSSPSLVPGVVKVADMGTLCLVPEVGSIHTARTPAGRSARFTEIVRRVGT